MTSKTKDDVSASSLGKPASRTKLSAKPHLVANGTALSNTKATAPLAKVSRVVRSDGAGHLGAKYAADLRARSLASAEDHTVDRAFLRKSKSLDDPLAEQLGEEAVMTMTSAEDQSDQLQYVETIEEIGGPFEVTTASQELAHGTDRSNPPGATREPFPKT